METTSPDAQPAAAEPAQGLPNPTPDRPFGRKRYQATGVSVYYTHVEAFRLVSSLARRSGLPRYLWTRVVTSFLNQYGLTLWRGKLYVQEELEPIPGGGYRKVGFPEDVQDYLESLDPETLEETEAGKERFLTKWQKIAEDLQTKHAIPKSRIDQLASDAYDAAGYRRAV